MYRYPLYTILITIIFYCYILNLFAQNPSSFKELSGPYLGQAPPGNEPELFAPGLISTAMYTRDMAMTPDGNEIYFCISALGYNLIFYTKQIDGHWTEPEPVPFISDFKYMYYEPHITPDGRRMLFLSNMPQKDGGEQSEDIWAVDRNGDGWSRPYNLGLPINTDGNEFFPSVTRDGTLYFTRAEKGSRIHFIYRSRFVNNKYEEPEKLGPEVNCGTNRYNAYIDRDERFIIVPAVGMEDSYGGTDYYIVFTDGDDSWSPPINMGNKVNSRSRGEYSAYISPDNKYFFFMSTRTSINNESSIEKVTYERLKQLYNKPQNGNADIYWMDASFIQALKP